MTLGQRQIDYNNGVIIIIMKLTYSTVKLGYNELLGTVQICSL